MDAWDIKNLAEVVILLGYGISLLYKLATVENHLKALIADNRNKLELSLADEGKHMAVLARDMDHLRYEVSNKLAEISKSQRDFLSRD